MDTPFLGSAYVARSANLSADQLINLFLEYVDTDKKRAAFFMCPGLDLFTTCGTGPIRGAHVVNNAGTKTLYVVSGNAVYSVTSALVVTKLGTISTTTGPVSMIDNGSQCAIFDSAAAYLVPGGHPLTGGSVGSAGSGYAVGDTITLQAADGTTEATAIATVATLSGSGVATFTVTTSGAFNPLPTSFTQASTLGSGSGFTLSSPTYGALSLVYTIPNIPFSVPVTAAYQDGFGIVNQLNSDQWFQSNFNDLSIWDALSFATSAAKPDQIVALADIHREVWLLKSYDLEVWVNAGLNGFVFQRIDGVFPEIGCAAAFSVAKAGESLIWLAQNDQGEGFVVLAEGYQPKRISTHAIEYAINSYSIISDAIAYVYEQEGHVFYVLTFPTGNATWVYDVTTGLWHQRAALSNGVLNRHWGNAYAFFNGKNIVGDYLTGNLYAFDMNTLTDNGTQRKWARSWRALPKSVDAPVKFGALTIDMQTGMGVPDSGAPLVGLRWSDDGGHNWSNQLFAAAGPTGATNQRVVFRRLGSTRRTTGLDRIFELSSTDQFGVALMGASISP